MSTSDWVNWLPDDGMIGNPAAAWWMIAALIAGMMCLVVVGLRRRAQRRFATEDRLDDFFDTSSFGARHRVLGGIVSAAVACVSLGLLSIALMDIRWGKSEQEVPQKGIEIMFLLDVSRSMLAEDVAPNRLERAKQMIRDMVQRMAGDRVGLLVFAGETRQTIPLTNHYEDFSQLLEDVSPSSVRRGGSLLGDAIESGGRAFLSKTNSHRIIVVLTDGEDQESEPVKMAKRLHADENIRIFTVGLGDMSSGARIPDVDRDRPQHESGRYVKYQGQPVWSKMNGEILREIATETQGAYIPAGTKQVDMGEIYDRYIAGMQATEFETAKVDAYVARFQWFALPAFVLLLIDFASRLFWRHSTRDATRSVSPLTVLFTLAIVASPLTASAQTIAETSIAEQANGQPATAEQPAVVQPAQAYNHGVELYRQGDFAAAADEFSRAVGASDDEVAASARYNLGTTCYAHAVQMLAAKDPESNGPPLPTQSTEAVQPDQVKELLNRGIDALRSALRLKPGWVNARVNLEKSLRLLAAIEQQEQNEDQQQNSDQKDSEQQNSEQQDAERENSDQQSSQQSNQSEGEDDQEDQESQQDAGDSDSQSQQSESDEQSQKGEESGDEPSEQQSQETSEQDSPSESQSEPSENESPDSSPSTDQNGETQQDMPQNDESAEPESQDEETSPEDVSGELSSDGGAEDSKSQNAVPPVAGQTGEPGQDDRPMTAEEAMKMLQAIRDRDMIRRFRLQQMQQQRQIPVERDW
ncbi:VWA domain-containing protein [Rhodopirellula sp. SWK7]|uniref:VWA domain-containing protein n=1 Tax=Rhodopirellula sp. SWK7 TaxID=595460 RepID=UPI0003456A6A|nr:VWA domain-containing protein [Rhodopirellula sp. SWK7]